MISNPVVNSVVTTTTSTTPAAVTSTVPLVSTAPQQQQVQQTTQSSSQTTNSTTTQTSTSSTDQPKSNRQEIQEKRSQQQTAAAAEENKKADPGKPSSYEQQIKVQSVVIQAMGYTPQFDVYKTMVLLDGIRYKPFSIYNNQKTVDNRRLGLGLYNESDRLHNELVGSQYNRKE